MHKHFILPLETFSCNFSKSSVGLLSCAWMVCAVRNGIPTQGSNARRLFETKRATVCVVAACDSCGRKSLVSSSVICYKTIHAHQLCSTSIFRNNEIKPVSCGAYCSVGITCLYGFNLTGISSNQTPPHTQKMPSVITLFSK